MSPLLDVQRSHATVGRIRLGARRISAKGKLAPVHLGGLIRITSPSREVVEAFATRFGGEPSAWQDDDRDEWQVELPVSAMPVIILPGRSLTQWWEAWDSGGCLRRCDGTHQVAEVGKPQPRCACPPDIEVRMADPGACRPTSQLLVVCPEVRVAGALRLVTRGLIAAQQLPSAIAVAEGMLERGFPVRAWLRVIHHRGRRDYVIPQLELVGETIDTLSGTSAASLPSAESSEAGGHGAELVQPTRQLSPPPASEDPGRPFTDEDEVLIPVDRQRRFAQVVAEWTKAHHPGPGVTKTTDAVRASLVSHATGGRTTSSRAVTLAEMPALLAAFKGLEDGTLILDIADDGSVVITDAAHEQGDEP